MPTSVFQVRGQDGGEERTPGPADAPERNIQGADQSVSDKGLGQSSEDEGVEGEILLVLELLRQNQRFPLSVHSSAVTRPPAFFLSPCTPYSSSIP